MSAAKAKLVRSKYLDLARENGIGERTYFTRVSKSLKKPGTVLTEAMMIDAATKPVRKFRNSEYLDLARINGIAENTYYNRLDRARRETGDKLTDEMRKIAATEPVQTNPGKITIEEREIIGRECSLGGNPDKLSEKYGVSRNHVFTLMRNYRKQQAWDNRFINAGWGYC